MKRRFLTGLLISVFLSLIINECYAWPEPPDIYISDWILYTEVGNSVDVVADVYSGGPIYYWDWDWPGALNGTYDEYSYSSTATVWSNTPGQYTVDVEGEDEYGQYDSDYAYVYVVAVTEVISSKDVACIGENVTFGALTDPPNCAHLVTVTWSGGGTPPTGSGSQFTTSWSTPGTKTVTATCGDSDAQKSVDIIDVDIDTPSSFPAYVELGNDLALGCTSYGATGGTYSWTASGPGNVTFSPSASAEDPDFSADQSGNYTVKVEYTKEEATASDTSGTIKVVKVKEVISSKDVACIGENVTFGAITDPLNCGHLVTVTWSGGGSPATGSGSQFTTNWSTPGTKTVTATCGDSDEQKNVDIVEVKDVTFSPTALCADGSSTSTASATITPDTRTITWSIQGNALGCTINSSTGVITAGTTAGTITVRAADSVLSGCYAEADIDVVKVEQNYDLWWFNGENPANYAIEVTLTAQGTTTGTFKWDVVAGAGKVNFENDSDTITKTNDNTVKVKSTAKSSTVDDVTINFTYNGSYVCNHKLTVYAPDHLVHIDNNDIDWYDGYRSYIKYRTEDQFDNILPYDVEVDEEFTSSCIDDYPGGADWSQPDDSGTSLCHPTWEDLVEAYGGEWYDPDPQNPQDPLGNTKVDHWSGDWYIGSTTDGAGVKVKSGCIWQRYLDHARHE